jgi:hypothetical protein
MSPFKWAKGAGRDVEGIRLRLILIANIDCLEMIIFHSRFSFLS